MFFFQKYTIDSRSKSHKLRRSLQVYKTTHIYCLKSYSSNLVLISFLQNTSARNSHAEVFCKKGVLKKFRKIHRKTPAPESHLQTTAYVCYYYFDGSYHGSYYISYHLLYLVLF